jgi:hypothetical protein
MDWGITGADSSEMFITFVPLSDEYYEQQE